MKYNVADAAELCADYLRQQNQLTDSSWLKLDISYGDYYIFKTRPYAYNLKLAAYCLSGIWVNGQTGEVKNVEKGGNIKVVLEHGKHIPFVYKLGLTGSRTPTDTTVCITQIELVGKSYDVVRKIIYGAN